MQPNIKSTIKLLFSIKMLRITGLMLTSGIIWGMIAGFIPKVVSNVVNEEDKLAKVINWMFILGVGQIVGSSSTGRIIDTMGDRFTILFIMGAITINCGVMLLAHLLETFTYFWYASSFLLGAIIVSINTHLGSIVGSSFENSTEAYGWNSFNQSQIVFFMLIFESLIKHPNQLLEQRIFIIFYGIFGIVSWLIALSFPFKINDDKMLNQKLNEIELIKDVNKLLE